MPLQALRRRIKGACCLQPHALSSSQPPLLWPVDLWGAAQRLGSCSNHMPWPLCLVLRASRPLQPSLHPGRLLAGTQPVLHPDSSGWVPPSSSCMRATPARPASSGCFLPGCCCLRALPSRPDSSGWVPPGCLWGRDMAGLWWNKHSMVVWLGLLAELVLLWGAVRAAHDTCMGHNTAQQQKQQAGADVSSTA